MKAGYLNPDEYKTGDKIRWGSKNTRPLNGNSVAEGYAECSKCNKDFWVDIVIKEDIILAIKLSDKQGYKNRGNN